MLLYRNTLYTIHDDHDVVLVILQNQNRLILKKIWAVKLKLNEGL